MPLIQVDLDAELFQRLHSEMSRELHQAQIVALGIPADDLFQVFTPHGADEIKFDPTYGGVDRRSLIVIRITMGPQTVAAKAELYRQIVQGFERLGIRPEDIQIAVVHNGEGDWYAGKL